MSHTATERLFDADPCLFHCDARVLRCDPAGDGWHTVLDRTVFFPRGGGQPCDLGTIGSASVSDVFEEGGIIIHLTDAPVSGAVACRIDGARRTRHMQYHLAQHILSAQLSALYGADTVIARIEDAGPHIELARALTPDELVRAQDAANDTASRDLPVRCFYLPPEEAQRLPVRGTITPHEQVRLVEIAGFDLNACGGTHCRSTGGIGQVLVTGTKEVRGLFRIYYAAGEDACALRRIQQASALATQQALGVCSPQETGDALCGHLEHEAALAAHTRALREALITADTARVLSGGRMCGHTLLYCEQVDGGDLKHLKAVADAVCAQTRACVLFSARQDEQISPLFARSKGPGPDLGALLRTLTARFGGRGGGSPIMAQGMLPAADGAADAVQQAMNETAALFEQQNT